MNLGVSCFSNWIIPTIYLAGNEFLVKILFQQFFKINKRIYTFIKNIFSLWHFHFGNTMSRCIQQLLSIVRNILVYINLLCFISIMCHLFFCAFFVLTDVGPVTLRPSWTNVLDIVSKICPPLRKLFSPRCPKLVTGLTHVWDWLISCCCVWKIQKDYH